MITEDKKLKTYGVLIIAIFIHVTGVLIGAWSDKYWWWIAGAIVVIPASILINIWWRKWK